MFNKSLSFTRFPWTSAPHRNAIAGEYRASLPDQKCHTHGAGYVMQASTCIRLQIMRYRKRVY